MMPDDQKQFHPPAGFYFKVIVDDLEGLYDQSLKM